MKISRFIICILCIIFISSCSADDANVHVKEFFSDPQVQALVVAADDGDMKTIDRLLASGVNVNFRGSDGITPLIWTIYHHKVNGYQALLEHGADPNLQIQSGRHMGDSAMETASQEQDSSYLKLALEHGGNPNLIDHYDDNRYFPLRSAILASNDHNVNLLVAAGANVNFVQNTTGSETPLEFAVATEQYHIAYDLLQAGANYKLINEVGPNKGHNPIVWGLEHGDLDPTSDAYKWRDKVIEFMNAHGVKVKPELPKPMCSEDLGNGVNVLAPCDQLNDKRRPK